MGGKLPLEMIDEYFSTFAWQSPLKITGERENGTGTKQPRREKYRTEKWDEEDRRPRIEVHGVNGGDRGNSD